MLRSLHSWPALVAAVLVSFMALTGAFLSLEPMLAHFATPASNNSASVATLAAEVAAQHKGLDHIARQPSGRIIAYYQGADGGQRADVIDPNTGASLGAYKPSGVFTFMTELHRSLFLGQGGRAVSGIAALSILVLAASGILLLVKRLGGWRQLLAPAKGRFSQRWHVELSRLAVLGLLITGLSGGYMSLVSFRVISDGAGGGFVPFPTTDGGTPAPIADLAALKAIPLDQLRELVFPMPGDPTDVFTVTTAAGQGFVDQATGLMLDFTPNSFGQTLYQAVYTLHTGAGLWWLGLLLGLAALSVPVLAATGYVMWWRRQQGKPRLKANVRPQDADAVILVGSEGNATWGFARELHDKLTGAGFRVHAAPMNALQKTYASAKHLFVLTSTHGDGDAPASARRFMSRLFEVKTAPSADFAVLGFGDTSFSHYCRFAEDVDASLRARGWHSFMQLGRINRQSPQAFAQWGLEVGRAIGVPLELSHVPARPQTRQLILAERLEYGQETQTPTVILRFVAPNEPAGWLGARAGRLPRFEAGDLLGIVPPQSDVPRYYSLATGRRDGFVEVCVRKQTGGQCSEFLHALEPGMAIDAFVEPNPEFRPQRGRRPVILIGAGTGIAPFAGFVRANKRTPIHLYWGGRDPQSDFLYQFTLKRALAEKRLTNLVTAFSRVFGGGYVQDALRQDGQNLRALLAQGAQVMVCGGRDMAEAVGETLDEILMSLDLDVAKLRARGRYVEDVY